MRLKYLELQGFKSFPSKTRLQFDNGLTVVVGPNGSGKSNISDAIRWVLGELSSKSMRGSSMQDVIFKGTSKRSPMTFAEVSLTFDNTEGTRLAVASDEVTVTRRYYRTGDSEYQINRQTVRLRDIVALFMNTGLGKSGYSMVNQGKTTEIISQKSDERRQIFEEAAGISKLRSSKVETERKMKSAEENLAIVRVRKETIEEHLAPLERDAERARKYLELYEQRKQADVSLWLYDMDAIREKLGALERDCSAAREELDVSERTIAALRRQIEELEKRLSAGKLHMEELQESRRLAADEKSQLASAGAGLEKDVEYAQTQIAETTVQLTAAQTLLAEEEAHFAELVTILEVESAALRTLLAAHAKLTETTLPAADKALADAENAVDENVMAIEEMEERVRQIELRLAAITTSESSAAEQIQVLLQKQAEAETATATQESALQGEEKKLAELAARRREMETEMRACAETATRLELRHRELTDEMNELHIKVNTNRNSVESLRRMEEMFSGYSAGVRTVMEAAKAGTLSGIVAPVSKLFTTENRYIIAIETAIGANIQNIVVEDEDAAKRAIAHLKQKGGRATFYPLTSIRPQYINLSDTKPDAYRGFLGVATEFTECEQRYEKILSYLLGRTLVFDNIDNATKFARATGFRTRIVTLDGQLLNVGGSFTGGAVRESGILSRSHNISDMEAEMARHQARMAEITAENNTLLSDMQQAKNRRVKLEEDLEVLAPVLRGKEVQVSVARETLTKAKAQLAEYRADLSATTSQSDGYQAEIVRLTNEQKTLDTDLTAAREARATLAKTAETKRVERDNLQEELHEHKLQLAVKQKEVEAATTAHQAGEAAVASTRDKIGRLEAQIADARQKIAAATASLDLARSGATNMDAEMQALQTEWETLRADCDEYERRLGALRAEVDTRRDEREGQIQRYSDLSGKKERLQQDQDKETAKIAEAYELTYGTALELGYPPVTAETYRAVKAVQTECVHKLRSLGSVNTAAIDQYREQKAEYDAIAAQMDDMEKTRDQLLEMLAELETEMSSLFLTTFEQINSHFGVVFERLFGAGGRAELSLSDPEHVLESGIEIHVAPPGKIITNLSLLSGGEQSCVAIALLFAILQVSPTPFCVLDEVEAALDEENVRRVAEYAKEYSTKIQMIMISHRRGTMEAADVLYGVTMAEQGVTTVLSVHASEVEKKLGVKF